jgi:hypothetical protein
MRRSYSAFITLTVLLLAAPAWAQSREPVEPPAEVVRAGKCRVPVCTDFDLGDHSFRFYAPERADVITFIPKGACQCASVRQGTFNDRLDLSVETQDRALMPNVGVLRMRPPDDPRALPERETTHERFLREAAVFKEAPFAWNDDGFPTFRVFQRLRPAARPAITDLYFVPREPTFRVRGQTQPIAFRNPLGSALESADYAKDGPLMSAQLRLTPTVHVFQFFSPRLMPSNQWIKALERTTEQGAGADHRSHRRAACAEGALTSREKSLASRDAGSGDPD